MTDDDKDFLILGVLPIAAFALLVIVLLAFDRCY